MRHSTQPQTLNLHARRFCARNLSRALRAHERDALIAYLEANRRECAREANRLHAAQALAARMLEQEWREALYTRNLC